MTKEQKAQMNETIIIRIDQILNAAGVNTGSTITGVQTVVDRAEALEMEVAELKQYIEQEHGDE
jgi:hypothetical protein